MKIATIQFFLIRNFLAGIFIVVIGLLECHSQDQNGLYGRIRDSIGDKPCPMATVMLLSSDSSIMRFTRSKKDGLFALRDIPSGEYFIMVTHPSFSAYIASIWINNNVFKDIGTIFLLPRSESLQAVIVTPRAMPPRMHGDTLEFSTNGVKTRVNATVEELLSRLPGVRVDQYGNITVNGKKVQRLLVDGEDIFSGDPTIVTRNFNADMIAKVQVLERKSDLIQFTGVDDGKRTTTLNLTLKEERKKGYFGKLEGGGGPAGYYSANGLLGAFKNRRQFAALGMAANNGNNGFNGAVGGVEARMNIGGGSGDALDASAGTGIPRIAGGGLHYANRWNGEESHIVGNYQYGRSLTFPYSSSIVRQTLPDSVYNQFQSSHSVNFQDQHGLNADYDYVPDSVSAFRFSVGGAGMRGNGNFTSAGSSDFNDTLVNSNLRSLESNTNGDNFHGSIMYRIQSAKKKTRSLSVIAGMARQNYLTKGYLRSINSFYQPNGAILQSDTIDQRKINNTKGMIVNSSISYVEPLWKNAFLGAVYNLSVNKNRASLNTYNKGDGKYEDYVDSLSSHYVNNTNTQSITLNVQSSGKKLAYTIGGDVLYFLYKQKDLLNDSMIRNRYTNFAPRAYITYNMTDYTGFVLQYDGATQQPSITQLQPIKNNNDPLHITIGNPDLRPGFTQNFTIGLHKFKPIVLNAGANYSFSTNGISNRTYTDSLGRQVSQAVNTEGANNGGLYLNINTKIKNIDLDIGAVSSVNYGRSVNYVNQYLSKNDNYNTGFGLTVGKFVTDKYSFQLFCNATYAYSRSSINPQAATHYWTQNQSGQITAFLPAGFELTSNFNYNRRQKMDRFDKNNSMMLWNAYLLKNLFDNRLALRCEINDILGENAGINRTISTNQVSEIRSSVIGRYLMLTASYRFTHQRKDK